MKVKDMYLYSNVLQIGDVNELSCFRLEDHEGGDYIRVGWS